MRKLFLLAALLLLAPLAAQAQVYPAPPNVGLAANRPVTCVASNPGQPLEPQWYFATDSSVLSICVATNTWQTITGGSGGGIGGGGAAGFLSEWLNGNTLESSLCQDLSGSVLACGESVSVGSNAFMISKTNSASGTTQFLAVAWDSSRNAITAISGNSVRGIAGLGAGTSGTVQIAIGGEFPWTCDNQTVVNDWLVLSTTTAGECHDAGATEPTGVQNIAQVAGANAGSGTATLADIFTPDTVNAPAGPPTVIQVNGSPLGSNTANLNSTTPAAQANNQNLTIQTDNGTPVSNISVEVPLATGSQPGLLQLGTDLGGSDTAPNVVGIQGIPCTLSGTPVAGQVWGFTASNACGNLFLGVPQRTYSIGTDTILSTDRNGWVRPTTSGTVATTLPQAGTTGFTANFTFGTLNFATGIDTITPTTSTINGLASVQILPNWFALAGSDNTNYFAAIMPTASAFPSCADATGHHLNFTPSGGIICGNSSGSGGGYATIENNGTSVTQQTTVNFIPAGSANVNCVNNSGSSRTDCTITGINGPPSPTVQTISGTSYTVSNSDNTWRDRFTNGPVAVTLPQANTIGTSPLVASRYNSQFNASSGTPFTSSSFTQAAGHQLIVCIGAGVGSGNLGTSTVSDAALDTFVQLFSVGVGTAQGLTCYYSASIAADATNTVTATVQGTASQLILGVSEFQGMTLDQTGTATSASSLTIPASFANEMGFEIASNTSFGVNAPPVSWTILQTNTFVAQNYRLVASQSTVTALAGPSGSTIGMADFGITGNPVFVAGWYVVLENSGTGVVTITPTTSTINGQTTLVIPPNGCYAVMSDGTNYNAIGCTIPNQQTNGVPGQSTEIAGVNTSATNTDVNTTTLITTGAANAFYEAEAEINCTTTTASAVETLTLTYTDTSSTVQTATAQATCTTLGSASIASIKLPFRAKASTNIQYGTVHTTAQATYDVSVAIYQLATK